MRPEDWGTEMRVVLDHSSQGANGVNVNRPLFCINGSFNVWKMVLVNSAGCLGQQAAPSSCSLLATIT